MWQNYRFWMVCILLLCASMAHCVGAYRSAGYSDSRFAPQQGDLELLRNPFTVSTEQYYITSDPDSIATMLESVKTSPNLGREAKNQGLNMYVNSYGKSPLFRYFQALPEQPVTYFILFEDGVKRVLAGLLFIPPQMSPVVEMPKGCFSYLFNRSMSDESLPKRLRLASYDIRGYVGDSLIMSGVLKF